MTRRDERENGRGATGHLELPHFFEVLKMSGLLTSVALNCIVVVVFFLAAILMTVGMLGMH